MASKAFRYKTAHSNESLEKGDTFAYPRQLYPLKGFPKGLCTEPVSPTPLAAGGIFDSWTISSRICSELTALP